jgi:UDP-2,3-diacylglucosamine pyrophosphatase LpxH
MIIAVSDVHLGYEACNKEAFKIFIEKVCESLGTDDHLVLVGDFLDFWRRNNVAVALENQDILLKLMSLKARVHYVAGNHDYLILSLAQELKDSYPFEVSKNVRLYNGGKWFYFTHGYELEVLANLEPMTVEAYETVSKSLCQMTEAFLGSILSNLWRALQIIFKEGDEKLRSIQAIVKGPERRTGMDRVEALARSEVKRLFLGLMKDDALVFGHTHRPFIDEKVANTGSWVSEAAEQNTYVTIENGKMALKKFS